MQRRHEPSSTTTASDLIWINTHLVLFFFVVAALFSPAQMVQAAIPQAPSVAAPSPYGWPFPGMGTPKSPMARPADTNALHPAERFSRALYAIKRDVQQIANAEPYAEAAVTHRIGLLAAIRELRTAEKGVQGYFDEIHDKLIHMDADPVIFSRHDTTVAEHDDGFGRLDQLLSGWEQDVISGSGSGGKALHALTMAVDTLIPDRPYNAIDLDRLPRRESVPVMRAPFQTPEQFSVYGIEELSSLSPADPQYLDPAIKQLIDHFDNDPMRIFSWVKENIRFVPTHGFRKSANACYHHRKGNAFDISNLLVVMLRAAGVSARFVLGTVQVDEWFFRKALGDFQVLAPALRLARHGGIPTQAVKGDQAVQMEHVWVEAMVGSNDEQWIALDPALKPARLKYRNLSTRAKMAAGKFFDRMLTAAQDSSYRISKVTVPPPGLKPNFEREVVAVGARFQRPAATLQHHVAFELVPYRYEKKTPPIKRIPMMALSDRSIQIKYEPATTSDRATIHAFGGLDQTPPDLIMLKARLQIENEVHLKGKPVNGGTSQELRVWFFDPAGNQDYADHLLTAGHSAVLGLDCQQGEGNISVGLQHDSDDFQTLGAIAQAYFQRADHSAECIAGDKEVAAIKTGEEALSSSELLFSRGMGGTPLAANGRQLTFDVQRSLHAAASWLGGKKSERNYHQRASFESSMAEHEAIEEVTGRLAVSAARLSLNNNLFAREDGYSFESFQNYFNKLEEKIVTLKCSEDSILLGGINRNLETSANVLKNCATGIDIYLIDNMGGAKEKFSELIKKHTESMNALSKKLSYFNWFLVMFALLLSFTPLFLGTSPILMLATAVSVCKGALDVFILFMQGLYECKDGNKYMAACFVGTAAILILVESVFTLFKFFIGLTPAAIIYLFIMWLKDFTMTAAKEKYFKVCQGRASIPNNPHKIPNICPYYGLLDPVFERFLNTPPIARDDSFLVKEDSGSNTLNVLRNDLLIDSDSLTITVSNAKHGKAKEEDGKVKYTPKKDFYGSDSFQYTISDRQSGKASTARVFITVENINDPPVAKNLNHILDREDLESWTAIEIIHHCSDPERNPLKIIGVTKPMWGKALINGTKIDYRRDTSQFSSDSFKYTISDGMGGENTATVNISIDE